MAELAWLLQLGPVGATAVLIVYLFLRDRKSQRANGSENPGNAETLHQILSTLERLELAERANMDSLHKLVAGQDVMQVKLDTIVQQTQR